MELSTERVAEILAALEHPHPAPAGADQRRIPRSDQRASVLVTPWTDLRADDADAPQDGLYSVTVRNCSTRGIAILHSRAMRRGEQFVVRLLNGSRETAAILCTVAHCRRVNPLFNVIGAEFTRLLRSGEIPPAERVPKMPQTLSA